MLGKILIGKKLFGGGKNNKRRVFYQNYGTFRAPDEYYFLPYSGKAKIVIDLLKVFSPRQSPSSTQSNTEQQ
jgi:hypothetical protein